MQLVSKFSVFLFSTKPEFNSNIYFRRQLNTLKQKQHQLYFDHVQPKLGHFQTTKQLKLIT